MTTLVYSPYYGPRPYVDLVGRGGVLMGETPVGSLGLLDALELFFGIKGSEPGPLERLVGYVKAMRQAVSNDSSLFFADSFRSDEIGTAKILLSWRDALMMARWTPEEATTEKLRGLASIETHFQCSGIADRWRSLLDLVLDPAVPYPMNVAIECRTSADMLEPCIRDILEALKTKGMPVSFTTVTSGAAPVGTVLRIVQDALLKGVEESDGTKVNLPYDGSFQYDTFEFGYDAARWAALSAKKWRETGTLLVNAQASDMNAPLRVLGQPMLRCDMEGAPQSAQLFLLGLSLFRKPVDVQRLLAYLRVSPNPIGKLYLRKTSRKGEAYFKALNRELTDLLLRDGGFMRWDEAIEAAVYDKDGSELTPAKRKKILCLFQMWDKTDSKGRVAKASLRSWLEQMQLWANGLAQVIPDDPGYTKLSSNCEAMEMLLEDAPDEIDAERISRWAEGIFSTITMTADIAEVGSGEAVPDIRDTMDAPDKVVWLGVCGSDAATYPYPFLSTQECELLKLPSREEFSAAAHRSLVESIARIKESLSLVSYRCADGAALTEHPIITELSARFKLPAGNSALVSNEDASCETHPVDLADKSKAVYQIHPEVFLDLDKTSLEGGLKPARESYSSLETLIQHPFDYVMMNLLRFEPYGEEQLSDIATVKGNVAHLYVHDLVEKCGMDTKRMAETHSETFDAGVQEAAEKTGAILLTRENGLEWGRFKYNLRISVERLLKLIDLNHYQIVGSEVKIETDLPVIGPFVGYVDLLLQDQEEKLVIFDFKWNEGSTYKKKMEKRDILQLILYKEVVQRIYNKEVSVYGYWLLPLYSFLTESECVRGDMVFPYHTESGDCATMKDLFVQVQNSYAFRMDQIRRGIIEEGELMPLADFEYYQKQDALNLYPLKGDYYDESIKGRPYGNDNITLKGGLE